jgi:hypothetical protein
MSRRLLLGLLMIFGMGTVTWSQNPNFPYLRPPTLRCQVAFDPSRELFTYTYRLTNNTQSTGGVDWFEVDIARHNRQSAGRVDAYNNPEIQSQSDYLEDMSDERKDLVVPVAFRAAPPSWDAAIALGGYFMFADHGTSIAPGQTGTFQVVSLAPPGPRQFKVTHWIDVRRLRDRTAATSEADYRQRTADNRAVMQQTQAKGNTLGPFTPPNGVVSPADLIGFMGSQVKLALKLGWISNSETAFRLQQKLDKAQAYAAGGNLHAAAKLLAEFQDELGESKGRHLNHDAYVMLRTLALYVTAKAGFPVRCDDDDDERDRDHDNKDGERR